MKSENVMIQENSAICSSALIVFIILYLAQTGFVGFFLIDWQHINSLVFFFGFEIIFIGIAFDITVLIGNFFFSTLEKLHH